MPDHLLSHNIHPDTANVSIEKTKMRISSRTDISDVDIAQQLKLLDELTRFDLGRFLLQHQGLNGYWTHYIVTHPESGRKTGKNNRDDIISELESFVLDTSPVVLATQERFGIFIAENQKALKNNAVLASIPCGMMSELLYLDFEGIDTVKLVGIDCDSETLSDAKALSEKLKLDRFSHFVNENAWNIDSHNKFDLISSNGLNIYAPCNDTVTQLYLKFYDALKPNGKLVTSFLTMPPHMTDQCEWNMSAINKDNLMLQKIIFADIIQSKWQCYRSTHQTQQQLTAVGFRDIEFIYDRAKIFPTVVAYK